MVEDTNRSEQVKKKIRTETMRENGGSGRTKEEQIKAFQDERRGYSVNNEWDSYHHEQTSQ